MVDGEPDAMPSPALNPEPGSVFEGMTMVDGEPDAGPRVARDSRADRAEDRYNDGVRAYRAGRYEEAAEIFLEAYEVTPLPLLIMNAGIALQSAGRCAEAKEVLRWFLDEQPQSPELGNVLQRLGELGSEC